MAASRHGGSRLEFAGNFHYDAARLSRRRSVARCRSLQARKRDQPGSFPRFSREACRREDDVLDFEVQPLSRRCAETDRELTAGETFYSALVLQDGQVNRLDYCIEAWQGPPPQALGWWTAQVPDYRSRRIHWAPQDVMLHYFEELESDRGQEDVRYVLALLMIRRKLLRLEETVADEDGRDVMTLFCSRNQTRYQAVVAVPVAERVAVIQQQLAELLFAQTE